MCFFLCVIKCKLISHRFGVIPILADILSDAQKEKVSRIILAVFRVKKPYFKIYTFNKMKYFLILFVSIEYD